MALINNVLYIMMYGDIYKNRYYNLLLIHSFAEGEPPITPLWDPYHFLQAALPGPLSPFLLIAVQEMPPPPPPQSPPSPPSPQLPPWLLPSTAISSCPMPASTQFPLLSLPPSPCHQQLLPPSNAIVHCLCLKPMPTVSNRRGCGLDLIVASSTFYALLFAPAALPPPCCCKDPEEEWGLGF